MSQRNAEPNRRERKPCEMLRQFTEKGPGHQESKNPDCQRERFPHKATKKTDQCGESDNSNNDVVDPDHTAGDAFPESLRDQSVNSSKSLSTEEPQG